jgi:cytochrome oxidase Cu insertion factor (SCO1/SenC/PrrC family)
MRPRHIIASAFAVLIIAASAFAQLGPKDGVGLIATELDRVKVGQPAPDFTLEDADGKAITLSDLRDKKSVVLVFYRGYW